ncbi:MAG: hypothetical protein ACLSGI_07170 [Butyricicoccaceae bacterium]
MNAFWAIAAGRRFFQLNGRLYQPGDLGRVIGSEIGIQIERPDRPGGVLFDNMTALDNLCTSLIPKAGQHIIRKKIVSSILSEALRWFPKEMLLQPLSSWSYPERLRFSYYRWYLLNPRLLICFFPFAGQESTHHKMIIDLLVLCAQRGMAVWIIPQASMPSAKKRIMKNFFAVCTISINDETGKIRRLSKNIVFRQPQKNRTPRSPVFSVIA